MSKYVNVEFYINDGDGNAYFEGIIENDIEPVFDDASEFCRYILVRASMFHSNQGVLAVCRYDNTIKLITNVNLKQNYISVSESYELDFDKDDLSYLDYVRDFEQYKEYECSIPNILNVIYNKPATIIEWDDGTKTVVKATGKDKYDKEKGLALAICRKALGNKASYYDVFDKWAYGEKDEK